MRILNRLAFIGLLLCASVALADNQGPMGMSSNPTERYLANAKAGGVDLVSAVNQLLSSTELVPAKGFAHHQMYGNKQTGEPVYPHAEIMKYALQSADSFAEAQKLHDHIVTVRKTQVKPFLTSTFGPKVAKEIYDKDEKAIKAVAFPGLMSAYLTKENNGDVIKNSEKLLEMGFPPEAVVEHAIKNGDLKQAQAIKDKVLTLTPKDKQAAVVAIADATFEARRKQASLETVGGIYSGMRREELEEEFKKDDSREWGESYVVDGSFFGSTRFSTVIGTNSYYGYTRGGGGASTSVNTASKATR